MKTVRLIILFIIMVPIHGQCQQTPSEQLAVAIDYFQSGKYTEALAIFNKLNENYRLNPRHQAYMGVCQYNTGLYREATESLDSIITQLEVFAPHERAVYYFSDAESHFQMADYKQAIDLFEQLFNVCHNNERGDALYRIGLCHIANGDKEKALECFTSAYAYYLAYPTSKRRQQTRQLKNMIAGLAQDLQ